MSLPRIAALAVLAAVAFGGAANAQTAPAPQAAPQVSAAALAPPKLIVTIVVDQFSANLFNQYRSQYTGGLRRMADQGLVSTNGYQTHGLTETLLSILPVRAGAIAQTILGEERAARAAIRPASAVP